jgi:hypothetical protein
VLPGVEKTQVSVIVVCLNVEWLIGKVKIKKGVKPMPWQAGIPLPAFSRCDAFFKKIRAF